MGMARIIGIEPGPILNGAICETLSTESFVQAFGKDVASLPAQHRSEAVRPGTLLLLPAGSLGPAERGPLLSGPGRPLRIGAV